MKTLFALVRRNILCYFKDKMLFFVSLITPIILLVLFVAFLKGVYTSSFEEIFQNFGFVPEDGLADGLAGAWLLSSIMSVCSVTVAFCSNAVMIQDKIEGNISDFLVAPVGRVTVQLSYFIANFIVTAIVMAAVLAVGSVYLAAVGWHIPIGDFLMIIVDLVCCVLFGTLLAGVCECGIKSQGGLSGVSTLVSSMYGFICGAYMPLSQFNETLRNIIGLLPGTYGVGIMRRHFMNGYVTALQNAGLKSEGAKIVMDSFDGNLYFNGNALPLWSMYVILLGACLLLAAVYFAIVFCRGRRKTTK